jgi:hypothetical protein
VAAPALTAWPHGTQPLGKALRGALLRDGIELALNRRAEGARRKGNDYFMQLDNADEVRGDRLLEATGRWPRVVGIGLESVGLAVDPKGIQGDEYLRAGERLWAIGMETAFDRSRMLASTRATSWPQTSPAIPAQPTGEAVPRIT